MRTPHDPDEAALAALTPAERRELDRLARDYDRRSQAARRPGYAADWDRRAAAMQAQEARRAR